MGETLERCRKATKKYMMMHGSEHLGSTKHFEVFKDEDNLVFVYSIWNGDQFISPEPEALKCLFENALAEWMSKPEHQEDCDYPMRCDEISFWIIRNDRAMLRHTKDAINI